MVDEVIDAFKQRIKKHKWIDEKTRKHVNSKVEQTRSYYKLQCSHTTYYTHDCSHLQ